MKPFRLNLPRLIGDALSLHIRRLLAFDNAEPGNCVALRMLERTLLAPIFIPLAQVLPFVNRVTNRGFD